ncbi:MAG: hypothetical protein BAA04_05010 [Firmicutes bacterium ZCTH02-B6]|nr:MAG: hypothetical protein BAA04_05010 [Firmicutes bacterium ZCTH02-B6]
MRVIAMLLAGALLFVASAVDPALGQVNSARIRVETALRYMALGWMREGREHLQQAVRLAPGWTEARVLLALSYHADGLWDQALTHYQAAVELDPGLAALHVLMGDIYLAQGRLDEAEAEYKVALETGDGAGRAYYGLGLVRQSRGETGAEELYTAAVAHAPDLIDARLRLARLLRAKGEPEAALEHLLHAQKLNSRLPEVRLELGLTYEQLGRVTEAQHEYRTVLRLDPGNDEARLRLGTLEAVQGGT